MPFILDTGSVESLIASADLRKFCPETVIQPTSAIIQGVTGHHLSLLGQTEIPIWSSNGRVVPIRFLVMQRGLTLLGLKAMKQLSVSITLQANVAPAPRDLQSKVAACKVAKGGFKVPPVRLEVSGDPVHLKRRMLPYGLREPVRQQLSKMLEDGIISEVESSAWGTPIVTPLKPDGKTPRICGDYRLTLNRSLLQQSCTTE